MDCFEPDFEIIKMDAEVSSYQEDFDSERERDEGIREESAEPDGNSASR